MKGGAKPHLACRPLRHSLGSAGRPALVRGRSGQGSSGTRRGGARGRAPGGRQAAGRRWGAGHPPFTASPCHLCRWPAPATGVVPRSWAAARRPPLSSPPRPRLGSALPLRQVRVQRRTPASRFTARLKRGGGGVPGRAPSAGGPGLARKARPAAAKGGGPGLAVPRRGVSSCFGSGRHSLQWERENLWGFCCAWPSGVPLTVTPMRTGPGPLDPRGVPVTWLEL